MNTAYSVHSGYQDDLGKISCTCSCSFTLSLSTQEWQSVQKWMGGGGGGELKVQFAQTLPQILSLVNLYSISIKLGNNWRSNFFDCTVFIKIMYNFPSELLVLWGANSQLKMAVYPLALASFWFSLTVQFSSLHAYEIGISCRIKGASELTRVINLFTPQSDWLLSSPHCICLK